MASATSYPHLTIDETGTAHIGRTRYKVSHLAAEHYHYGWTAEELLRQHPDLRPEKVYAALTYFYDHYEELLSAFPSPMDNAACGPSQSVSRAELMKRRNGAS